MKRASIFQRLIFVLIILLTLFEGEYNKVAFILLVFFSTGVFIYLAKFDERFWLIDTLILFLFLLSLTLSEIGMPLVPSIFGLDKLFHFVMGGLVAWTGIILLKPYIKNEWIFRLSVICFTTTVAFIWEVYEWLTLPIWKTLIPDTMLDIIMAMIAAVALLVFVKDDKKSK